MLSRRTILAFTVAWTCALPAAARASPDDAQLQAARELFHQAERDEDAGLWSDALAELRRVGQVKLTAGVRYHIALCEEHLGQVATALADYTTAEGQARGEHAQDVLRLVGRQIAAVEPRVPRLTIRIVPEVPEAVLRLDGVVVAKTFVGVAMPVDPGVHRVEAEAPNRPVTRASVTLHEHDNAVLDVALDPFLAPPPAPRSALAPSGLVAPAAEPAANAHPGGARARVHALATTAGAAGLAVGGIVAFVVAGNALARGQQQCATVVSTGSGACDAERETVRSWDFAAAGAWIAAAALGTVSMVLWSWRDGGKSSALVVGPRTLDLRSTF